MLRIIDKNGLFLRDDFGFDPSTEIGLDVAPAQGLYRPKWDGEKWVEDMPRGEIDALLSQPPLAPSLEDRVGAVENKTATIEETLDVLFGGAV